MRISQIVPLLAQLLLAPAILSAQAMPWIPVQGSAPVAKSVAYRFLTTDKGPVLELKNTGDAAISFHFRFLRLQTREQALSNGRVTLTAKTGHAQIPLPVLPNTPAQIVMSALVKAFDVREGVVDQGDFETEDE